MGKTIRFGENSLIAIKKKLNEIMAGSDDIVSHNDVGGKVKLYHGTDILALVKILKTNRVCASEGRQHGETHGMNWFSLENDGSFNRGACFSIEVPKADLDTVFHKMNNVHVVSKDSCLDISGYNPKVEYFCGHTRESLNSCYKILIGKGERYPIEWMRDEIFYNWCDRSGNEDTYMSVGDQDFGLIMANILGEEVVCKEGFLSEEVAKEFAPVASVGMEKGGGPGLYAHMDNEKPTEDVNESREDSLQLAIKFRPDKYNRWAVIFPSRPGLMPQFFEKVKLAKEFKRWYGGDCEIVDLDKYALNEHHLDQRLPFKEPKYAYKYAIEQYRDWLEEFGRYGELPAGTLDFWNEIENAAKYIYENKLENGNNKEKDFYAFINYFHKTPKGIVGILKRKRIGPYIKITDDNKVYVERVVFAPSKMYGYDKNGMAKSFEPDSRTLDRDNVVYDTMMNEYGFNVGGCWSYKVNAAEGYCKNSLGKSIILRGYIRTDDIDYVKTALLNFEYPTEHEIRVKPFAKVELFNFSFGKMFDEGFDTINFEKPLIVSSTYSGNKEKNFDGIMSIDDGFGGMSFVDINKKPVSNDEYFSKLNAYINSIENFEKKSYNEYFEYVGSYGDMIIVGAKGKVNFYNCNNKHLVSDMWFDRYRLPKNEDANFREMIDTILAEIGNDIYAINAENGSVSKTNMSYDDIDKVTSFADKITENVEKEVESSEVDLSSFKKRDTLPPGIWKDEETLNSKVRLKLLDIADDFWKFVNLTWVEPKGIIITGSICNFNWSKFSDIDLHLVVDFNEIDEKTEFVKQYLDSKKNEWNSEHEGLKIMGFPVELYTQDVSDNVEAGGIYDLEENAWIRRPNPHTIKNIGLEKFGIKNKAAEIMTIIDEMYKTLSSTDDGYEVSKIGEDAHYLWDKVKDLRKKSLTKRGENGAGNIVYKVLRRTGYLDKLFKLFSATYDKSNSISEGKKIYISENKLALLAESQESKSISAAKKLAMQRLGYNEQEADEFVRVKLRNDIPSLRTPEGGKFILGVTRMFCDGEINDAETIGNLNKTIKLVASDAHINEYDRNLNGMSAQDLIFRFEGARGEMLDADKQELASMVFEANNDYEIVRIDSFEQSSEYGEYVSWCVTHSENMFDSYTNDGFNQFYFCLKNGWHNEELFPEVKGENCPLDEYGLSMIAVSVDRDGGLNTCTCRWNHDNGGNDGIMNTKQISTVIGRNFYDVFKPNNKWGEMLNSAMESIANGEDPRDVFDWCDDYYSNGFLVVELGYRKNYVDTNGQILSDKWFDQCYKFDKSNFGMVNFKKRWNFIDKNGQLLSKQWFDEIDSFYGGWAYVKLNDKRNFINTEGQLLWNKPIDQWFDEIYAFNGGTINLSNGTYKNEGFARFRLNDKWNFINTEGQLLWNKPIDQWFDGVRDFEDNFGFVEINSKWNFINTEGQLLWNKPIDQWFDGVREFDGSCAIVRIGYKRNFINTEGQLLWNKPIDQWFDNITEYRGRFVGKVSIDNKWNFIDSKGQLLWNKPADQWFDYITNFVRGRAEVRLNGNIYTIDTNGNLTLKESENTYNLPYLNESVKKCLNLLKEEFAMDGSSEGNPYQERWKAERDALKNFVANYGKLMQSKEDNKMGRLYKVYYDKTLSELIGYNYCVCVQWDEMKLKPKSTVYIRALDKFTPFIRRNIQFDNRGMDNQMGTADDIRY